MNVDIDGLKKRLGIDRYKLPQPELLARAMVHRSYLNESGQPGIQSNERLEFLGDAVLGCIIAEWLFDEYPGLPEGRLTELRAHVVKGETLALVADRLGLGQFLLLGRGEEATGGRRRPVNLGRAFEAVVGAVYLNLVDRPRGFDSTKKLVLGWLAPELSGLGEGTLPLDAKSRLQQVAQTIFGTTPRYHTVAAEGPDHAKVFTIEVMVKDRVLGAGRGHSKHIAQTEAAQAALERIERETAAGTQTA